MGVLVKMILSFAVDVVTVFASAVGLFLFVCALYIGPYFIAHAYYPEQMEKWAAGCTTAHKEIWVDGKRVSDQIEETCPVNSHKY